MNNCSKIIYKPSNPCRPQLYKVVKYRYYRFPVKYICTPVEWGTKCEKHVSFEPEKPYPSIKVGCDQLQQSYYGGQEQYYSAPDCGCAQDAYYEADGYAKADGYANDCQNSYEDGGDYAAPDHSCF